MPAESPNLVYILFFVLSALAIWGGIALAKSLRMPDHGWKLALIFVCIVWSALVCRYKEPNRGIDLRGGDILIYEVDKAKSQPSADAPTDAGASGEEAGNIASGSADVDMNALVQSIVRRINPTGLREVVVRAYGENQLEIIIPEVDDAEIETIKDTIRRTGFLKFRILADQSRHPVAWELADKQVNSDNETERRAKFVKDGDKVIAEWVRLGREESKTPGVPGPYRFSEEIVKKGAPDYPAMKWRENVPGQIEILAVNNPDNNVDGSHLSGVGRSLDDMANPRVDFQMTNEGAGRMGALTGENLPDDQIGKAKLGIILDDQLLSAPVINSRITYSGVIEGGFTEKEVEVLLRILRDGKLPAVLYPDPISENKISPLLGVDTIRKGSISIIGSLIVVMLFMLWYYNFAGIVACLALVLNMVLTVALMILLGASFTLPGIAGLVLTVGMSVDSNVLIFERIREEMARGTTLRMAIRNGFERAMSTIIDSNVTTLIVAFVLYFIGTADIRGFGISLILGIITSMFTAIFCSRVCFDIFERHRWITTLKMRQIIGETHYGFMNMRWPATIASLIVIGIGLVAAVLRGPTLFDIDFRGGTTVQVALKEPLDIAEVRTKLADVAEDVWVTEINPQGAADDTVYKIDTSLGSADELRKKVQEALVDSDGNSLQTKRTMSFTPAADLKETSLSHPPSTRPRTDLRESAKIRLVGFQETATTDELENSAEPATLAEEASADVASTPNSAEVATPSEVDPSGAQDNSADSDKPQSGAADAASAPTGEKVVGDEDLTTKATGSTFRTRSELKFDQKIGASALTKLIEMVAIDEGIAPPIIQLRNPDWDGGSERGFDAWELRTTSSREETDRLLARLQSDLESQPVWLASSTIGDKIAGDLTMTAVGSTILSLILIVAYLWVRFHRAEYGIAAAVAVVHDVLVTLGFVALSYWFLGLPSFLMIQQFKISLPVVAAFLTLIGYSLNDTIVIFDRIREVKGKQHAITAAMIDQSVNQTLSRSILTSLTVFMVVVVLYFFGGEGIHPFAYALVVGVIAGSYSTIFIASPILLWLTDFMDKRKGLSAGTQAGSRSGRAPAKVTHS